MQYQERLLADAQQHNLSRQLKTEEHEKKLAHNRNRQMQRRDVHWKDQLNFHIISVLIINKDLI